MASTRVASSAGRIPAGVTLVVERPILRQLDEIGKIESGFVARFLGDSCIAEFENSCITESEVSPDEKYWECRYSSTRPCFSAAASRNDNAKFPSCEKGVSWLLINLMR
jgi:hypothetical protein